MGALSFERARRTLGLRSRELDLARAPLVDVDRDRADMNESIELDRPAGDRPRGDWLRPRRSGDRPRLDPLPWLPCI